MKRKDMEAAMAAGTEVAVVAYRPRKGELPAAQRATITALGQARTAWVDNGRWGSHQSYSDGVAVSYAEAAPEGRSRDDVVAPRNIYMPWAEYAAALGSARAERDAEGERLANLKTRAQAAAARLGGSAKPDFNANYKLTGYRVIFTVDEAEKLSRDVD